MFCTKCGANNPDGAAFCSGCGAPLKNATESATPKPQPQPQSQPQSQPQPQPAMPKKHSSVGAIVLSIVLTAAVVAALAVGAYFFLLRDDNESSGNSSGTGNTTEAVTKDSDKDEELTADEETASNSAVEVNPPSVNVKDDESREEYVERVLKNAISELHEYTSWSEYCDMDYQMTYGGQTIDCKSEILANVYDYDPDDLDKIRIEGSGRIEAAGSEQEWTCTYKNGKMTYNYIKPSASTATLEMDPAIFNMDTLSSDMIKNVKISGNTMKFTIDMDKAKENLEILGNAFGADSGIDSVEYSDIKVNFVLDDDTGLPESYEMEFSSDITANGITMAADYEILYTFTVNR